MHRRNDRQQVQIKNKPLVRDIFSKAVLSTDTDGLKAYQERKRVHVNMKNIESELNNMKSDIEQIKELLIKLTSSNGTK